MLSDIEALKARWMTGADTAGAGPEDWQDMDPLAQLALAGQFTRIATRPGDASKTSVRPELPSLALPPLADEHRPLLRRALESKEVEGIDLVTLLATRGYCVNPLDWMPKRNDASLPPLYTPWRDWLEGGGTEAGLSAETWDDQPPHSRYVDLEGLHRADPDAARTLIAGVAPTVAADQRLRLLDCLRPALTSADVQLLEIFLTDRSSKVQALVKTQLARLGRLSEDEDAEAAAEVPDYLQSQKSGILSRKVVVTGRKLKTDAQRRRRRDILSRLSLDRLSAALDMTPDEFIERWDFGEANDEVNAIVAATGTDTQVERLLERSIAQADPTPYLLLERLSPEQRMTIGLGILAKDDWRLETARQWLNKPDGTAPLTALPAKLIPELIKQINNDAAADHQIGSVLTYLGMLLDRAAAAALLEKLTQAGLLLVDPRLTLLRLNAAL
ncbi:DUF5691 domain-containing protein [Halovulum sp. GXIMD14793]